MECRKKKLASKEGVLEERLESAVTLLNILRGNPGTMNSPQRVHLYQHHFQDIAALARLMG